MNIKKATLPFAIVLLCVLSFVAGNLTTDFFLSNGIPKNLTDSISNSYHQTITQKEGLERLKDFLEIINTGYYKNIDNQKVFDAIYKATFSSLDDHSKYFDPKETQEFIESTSGKFGGIGAYVIKVDKYVRIRGFLGENSPAKRAGICLGDDIAFVDGESMEDKDTKDVIEKLRGNPRTKVKIKIKRSGNDNDLEFTIVREVIEKQNLTYSEQDNIGIIKIDSFTSDVSKKVKELIDEHKNIKGLIIDLRNNGGGSLDQVVDLSAAFLKKDQEIVNIHYKGNISETKRAKRDGKYQMPLAVLINENSASASEIFAGSMKENGRAIIVGETSYGKGTVQTWKKLKDNTAFKLTIAEYKLAKNIPVDKVGISPNIVVEDKYKDLIKNLVELKEEKSDLKLGDTGIGVLAIQQRLEILGYNIKPNAVFDENTNKAVTDFQEKNKLPSTGIIDKATKTSIIFELYKKIFDYKEVVDVAIKEIAKKLK